MAQNAAEMLVRAIEEKETPSSVVLPVSLVRRGSTRLEEKINTCFPKSNVIVEERNGALG